MKSDAAYMQMAIEKARAGIAAGQTPFGACLVKDGEVLACTHNTVWAGTDITAHAEINVLREACRRVGSVDLSGATIYSTCEPCPMCFSACLWARVSKVVFRGRHRRRAEGGVQRDCHLERRHAEAGRAPRGGRWRLVSRGMCGAFRGMARAAGSSRVLILR